MQQIRHERIERADARLLEPPTLLQDEVHDDQARPRPICVCEDRHYLPRTWSDAEPACDSRAA